MGGKSTAICNMSKIIFWYSIICVSLIYGLLFIDLKLGVPIIGKIPNIIYLSIIIILYGFLLRTMNKFKYYPRNTKKYEKIHPSKKIKRLFLSIAHDESIDFFISPDLFKFESLSRIVDINYAFNNKCTQIVLNEKIAHHFTDEQIKFILAREWYYLKEKKELKNFLMIFLPITILIITVLSYVLFVQIDLISPIHINGRNRMFMNYLLPAIAIIIIGVWLKYTTKKMDQKELKADCFAAEIVGEKTAVHTVEKMEKYEYVTNKAQQWYKIQQKRRIDNIRNIST